jgi:hypothetical protein
MLSDITTATGIPFRETQWVGKPPAETYGIWMDDVTADGSDFENRIFTHDTTLELYEPKPDPEAEKSLEDWLNARGLKWTKQARYWITEALRYQVVYDFSYTEKI